MTTLRKCALFVGTPAAGIIALIFLSAFEHAIREAKGLSTGGFIEGGSPFLWFLYGVFCWVYIIPVVALLRTRCSGPVANTFVMGLLLAGFPWIILTLIFHIPDLDELWQTAVVIGFVFGIPIFASAVVAAISFGPNKEGDGKPDTDLR